MHQNQRFSFFHVVLGGVVGSCTTLGAVLALYGFVGCGTLAEEHRKDDAKKIEEVAKVFTVEELRVVDKDGNLHLRLGTRCGPMKDWSGMEVLERYEIDKKPVAEQRAFLGMAGHKARVFVCGKDCKSSVELAIAETDGGDGPLIFMTDSRGTERFNAAVRNDKESTDSYLILSDVSGNPKFGVRTAGEGPEVVVGDPHGTEVRFGVEEKRSMPYFYLTPTKDENDPSVYIFSNLQQSCMSLSGPKSSSALVLAAKDAGESSISWRDNNQKPRVLLGIPPNGPPAAKLMDDKGKTLWSALPEPEKKEPPPKEDK